MNTNLDSTPVALGHSLSWHMICASSSLQPGRIIGCSLPGEEIVVYRGNSGRIFALSAHCSHMGTHLANGLVMEDSVRCPLHHWRYDGTGRCTKMGARSENPAQFRQRSFPVVERYGLVFVFNAPEALFPPPQFSSEGLRGLAMFPGKSVTLNCPLQGVVANGFDRQHFETVHERALRAEPEVTQPEPQCLRLRYTSRVTGKSLADRTMKWISRDFIKVSVTCWGGTIVLVESDLGRTRSALLLSFMPSPEGTTVTPVFAVYKSRIPIFDTLRLRLAAWLFSGFLRRDVAIMNGMRFNPMISEREDPVLYQYLQYIRTLPRAGCDVHGTNHCSLNCEERKDVEDREKDRSDLNGELGMSMNGERTVTS